MEMIYLTQSSFSCVSYLSWSKSSSVYKLDNFQLRPIWGFYYVMLGSNHNVVTYISSQELYFREENKKTLLHSI